MSPTQRLHVMFHYLSANLVKSYLISTHLLTFLAMYMCMDTFSKIKKKSRACVKTPLKTTKPSVVQLAISYLYVPHPSPPPLPPPAR